MRQGFELSASPAVCTSSPSSSLSWALGEGGIYSWFRVTLAVKAGAPGGMPAWKGDRNLLENKRAGSRP